MFWRRFYNLTIWCFVLLIGFIFWFKLLEPFFRAFMVHNQERPAVVALRKRFFPEDWKLFTSQEGRFRVLAPGGYLNHEQTQVLLRHHAETMYLYQTKRPDPISYTISYCALPKQLQTQQFLKEMSDVAINQAKGKRIETRTLKLRNLAVQEHIIQIKLPRMNQIASGRHRLWFANNRLYQMLVITPNREASRYESDRFMNSLELLP